MILNKILQSPWRLSMLRKGHTYRYIFFFVIVIILLRGEPKRLFPSFLHLPWMNNVQHVQILTCQSSFDQPDWPHPQQTDTKKSSYEENYLTVVIVTARPEFKRLPLTLVALIAQLDHRNLAEVMMLVPPNDVHLLQNFINKNDTKSWPWPLSIRSDDTLLKHHHVNSYRLQMMFKLFLAQIVQTEYYLILDSDCMAIWPIHVDQLLHPMVNIDGKKQYRAIYQIEGKLGHESWWKETEGLSQSSLETCSHLRPESSPTMGVTPSIMSRTIALRTLCRLQKLYGDQHFLNRMANWALWKLIFGGMWTEYTLYFLTGSCTKIFDRYHIHHSNFSTSSNTPRLNLYGFSIWSSIDWTIANQEKLVKDVKEGLDWRRKECETNDGQAILDQANAMHSLFSVLQGRHGVNPMEYHRLLYPIFLNHLKKRNKTENLVKVLESLTSSLIQI